MSFVILLLGCYSKSKIVKLGKCIWWLWLASRSFLEFRWKEFEWRPAHCDSTQSNFQLCMNNLSLVS